MQAAADAEMSKLSDQQNVINELEHHNNSVRMQLEDSKLEIAHSHERLLAFERSIVAVCICVDQHLCGCVPLLLCTRA